MPNSMYNVLALIPEGSDFTLDTAVRHFSGLTFSKFRSGVPLFKRQALHPELAVSEGKDEPTGFRVFYGEWAVVAWLETWPHVLDESREMSEMDDPPVPTEVIAGCRQRLSVWSDEDSEFDWSDEFTDYTNELRERFGLLIRDCVNGCWWT